MPVLYFLPWVSTLSKVSVGDLELTPYERKVQPADLHGIPLADIDAILGNYGNQAYYPSKRVSERISTATLVTWSGNDATRDPTDTEIRNCLQVGQQVAFCALAQRVFCSHFEYCNSDGYRMIAQRFQIGSGGPLAVTTRRRDGQTLQYLGREDTYPRFIRPLHVDSRLSLNIDVKLFEALRSVTNQELQDRLAAAINVFLGANTDAQDVPERTEMVLLRVAFETLLNSTHETKDLVRCFSDHFSKEVPSVPTWHPGQLTEAVWRTRWPSKTILRPLDAWVNDFCSARNSAAHGPRGSKGSPIWTTQNHLLFASWLFPLVVKGLLSSTGLYELTDEDKAMRKGFEAFFSHDVLTCVEEDKPELHWSRVERSLLFPVMAKRIYPTMRAK